MAGGHGSGTGRSVISASKPEVTNRMCRCMVLQRWVFTVTDLVTYNHLWVQKVHLLTGGNRTIHPRPHFRPIFS